MGYREGGGLSNCFTLSEHNNARSWNWKLDVSGWYFQMRETKKLHNTPSFIRSAPSRNVTLHIVRTMYYSFLANMSFRHRIRMYFFRHTTNFISGTESHFFFLIWFEHIVLYIFMYTGMHRYIIRHTMKNSLYINDMVVYMYLKHVIVLLKIHTSFWNCPFPHNKRWVLTTAMTYSWNSSLKKNQFLSWVYLLHTKKKWWASSLWPHLQFREAMVFLR